MPDYESRYWTNDGLKLHFRDYPGDPAATPLLCLPGLTRNARDYDALARRLAGARRVLSVDLRGRGRSEYARDPMSYMPRCYVGDIKALLEQEGIGRVALVGTSLGGIVAMLLAASGVELAALVLNDVGPEIEAGGLSRIRGYVGRGSSFPTWMHAARAVQEANAEVYPDWGIEDWLNMAKRLYRLTSSGRIVLDYDLKIAEPFKTGGGEADADMWNVLRGLRDTPVLLVRGERSDVLGRGTAERMMTALHRAELLTVLGVGHAPTLAEPGVTEAIERLLATAG